MLSNESQPRNDLVDQLEQLRHRLVTLLEGVNDCIEEARKLPHPICLEEIKWTDFPKGYGHRITNSCSAYAYSERVSPTWSWLATKKKSNVQYWKGIGRKSVEVMEEGLKLRQLAFAKE